MFTGIVQDLRAVEAVESTATGVRLDIALGPLAQDLQLGASVAINGTCLTVTSVSNTLVSFDVIPETLELTNLGTLRAGEFVNIERSYRVGDEVGGHIVSGHVTGQAKVAEIAGGDKETRIWFEVPAQAIDSLLMKGFVALDGASLTISNIDRDASRIEVSLIPETLARTTLGRIAPGGYVNLEVDQQTAAIVTTVERVLASDQWLDRLAARLEQRATQ